MRWHNPKKKWERETETNSVFVCKKPLQRGRQFWERKKVSKTSRFCVLGALLLVLIFSRQNKRHWERDAWLEKNNTVFSILTRSVGTDIRWQSAFSTERFDKKFSGEILWKKFSQEYEKSTRTFQRIFDEYIFTRQFFVFLIDVRRFSS